MNNADMWEACGKEADRKVGRGIGTPGETAAICAIIAASVVGVSHFLLLFFSYAPRMKENTFLPHEGLTIALISLAGFVWGRWHSKRHNAVFAALLAEEKAIQRLRAEGRKSDTSSK